MEKRKIQVFLFFVFILLGVLFGTEQVQAATQRILEQGELFKINNKTIRVDTTYNQLVFMFGEPVVTTDSAFGGQAYTFRDDTKLWLVHVETNAEGSIVGYGGIGDNFTSRRYQSGDKDPYSYYYFSGSVVSSYYTNYAIYGVYDYNGLSASIIKNYWTTYMNSEGKCLFDLQKHAIEASRVYATRNGDPFTQEAVSEDIFYMSEQLKTNNSTLYNYAWNTGKTSEIYSLGSGYYTFNVDLPNPIHMGSETEHFIKGDSFKYVLYDIRMYPDTLNSIYETAGTTSAMFINPDFVVKRKSVQLTDEENDKLEKAKEYYAIYKGTVEEFNNNDEYESFYEVTPVENATPLVAGKVHNILLEGSTAYLNTIRAGAGLGPIALDLDMCDAAQHKAVLVTYMNNYSGLGSGFSHYLPKVDEVSEEFYNKAQSNMAGENLYTGTVQSSIANALNDGYGDPIEGGHRYNLIDPSWSKWGVGQVGGGISFGIQAAHKFGGYQTCNEELVAWPSVGITPFEVAVSPGIGNWSARFYKGGYDIYSVDKVTIKNLNTESVITIAKDNLKTGQKLEYVAGSQLTFNDSGISVGPGDTIEVTLHNVKNMDGDFIDYSYRTTFYNFSETTSNEEKDIELSKTSVSVSIAQSQRVIALAKPDDAKDKLMLFESIDEDIATVRQDGTIKGVSPGDTIVLVKYGNVEKAIAVHVDEYQKGDVNKDGSVNVEDAGLILDIYKGNVKQTDDLLNLGDMNSDRVLDVQDAGMILDKYKGLL